MKYKGKSELMNRWYGKGKFKYINNNEITDERISCFWYKHISEGIKTIIALRQALGNQII